MRPTYYRSKMFILLLSCILNFPVSLICFFYFSVKILLSVKHFLNDRFMHLRCKVSTNFPVLSTLTTSKLYVCEQLTNSMYVYSYGMVFIQSLAYK